MCESSCIRVKNLNDVSIKFQSNYTAVSGRFPVSSVGLYERIGTNLRREKVFPRNENKRKFHHAQSLKRPRKCRFYRVLFCAYKLTKRII